MCECVFFVEILNQYWVNIQFSCITFPSFFFWSFFRQARKWRLGEVAASFTVEQYTTVTNYKIKLE